MKPPTTVAGLLRYARGRIEPGEAEQLLAHVLQRARGWLYSHGDEASPDSAREEFAALLTRRIAGEPLAYVVGRVGFRDFDLDVTPAVLIPRAETELLVEAALASIPLDTPLQVADLGTGSGAIAIAIARERPRARLVALDTSEAALEVARANAVRLDAPRIEFRLGDWFTPLAGERFDVIASNPPYIADNDPHLQQGDLPYEPMLALASGVDGLAAIGHFVRTAPAYLQAGGRLLLEHGWQQGAAVRGLMATAGFSQVLTLHDIEERERVTSGRRD